MGRGLAREDEVAAGVVDGSDDRLAGEEIITEIDRPEVSDRCAVPGQPALRGVAFTILLLCPVPRHDEFWREGQDLLVAWRNQAGTQEGMEALRAAVRTLPHRAVPALDLARAEMLGPVQRDQRPPTQALEPRQRPCCLDRLEEQRVERCRRRAVQHLADIVVRGDRRDAEQRLAVRPAMALLQRPLMRQERRTSHEEYRERGQTDPPSCSRRHAAAPCACPADRRRPLSAQRSVRQRGSPERRISDRVRAQGRTTAWCGEKRRIPQPVTFWTRPGARSSRWTAPPTGASPKAVSECDSFAFRTADGAASILTEWRQRSYTIWLRIERQGLVDGSK